jgi:hypothetical protein
MILFNRLQIVVGHSEPLQVGAKSIKVNEDRFHRYDVL